MVVLVSVIKCCMEYEIMMQTIHVYCQIVLLNNDFCSRKDMKLYKPSIHSMNDSNKINTVIHQHDSLKSVNCSHFVVVLNFCIESMYCLM
jgi:hypothetical protein